MCTKGQKGYHNWRWSSHSRQWNHQAQRPESPEARSERYWRICRSVVMECEWNLSTSVQQLSFFESLKYNGHKILGYWRCPRSLDHSIVSETIKSKFSIFVTRAFDWWLLMGRGACSVGGTADSFTLFERLESKLEEHSGIFSYLYLGIIHICQPRLKLTSLYQVDTNLLQALRVT